MMIVMLRTVFFYFFIFIIYRLMGKREVGQLSITDLIVSLLIAELTVISIENYNKSILYSLIPMVILVLLQCILAYISLKKPKMRILLEGNPSVIIKNGKINYNEMLKQRYNLDDLLMELRSQGIKSIEDVDYAILEINGRLSVFEKDGDDTYPLPLVLNGKIDNDVLLQIGKDEEWLQKVVKEEGYSLENVFYGFYKDNEVFFIKNETIK